MYVTTAGKLFEPVLDAATDLCWRQWGAIASGSTGGTARTIIDPEALLVTSLVLCDREPRLGELVDWFMISLSQVLSVGRTRRLATKLTPAVEDRLKHVAGLAVYRGRDARWKKLDPPANPGLRGSLQMRGAMKPRYQDPAALVFRLRMGFGVGIKADVLAFLLGTKHWCTTREIGDATAWNPVAVRRALDDLVLAGFIESSDPVEWQTTRSKQYRADRTKWTDAAHLAADCRWGYHKDRFELAMRAAMLLDPGNAAQQLDALALGAWAENWTRNYGAAFRFGDTEPKSLLRGKLEEQGEQFQANIVRLAEWMREEG